MFSSVGEYLRHAFPLSFPLTMCYVFIIMISLEYKRFDSLFSSFKQTCNKGRWDVLHVCNLFCTKKITVLSHPVAIYSFKWIMSSKKIRRYFVCGYVTIFVKLFVYMPINHTLQSFIEILLFICYSHYYLILFRFILIFCINNMIPLSQRHF